MKLSIITINRNNSVGLRKTIHSVSNQTFKDFEYIVIDGDSDDDSVEVIKKYADSISFWKSEPDTGIYQAMNKGIKIATGQYLLMLNSGDYLVDSAVVGKVIQYLDGTDLIQGNIIKEYSSSCIVRDRGYGRSDISFYDAIGGHFLHQAMFVKRTLHDKYGLYEEEFKINADSFFFVRSLAIGNASFRYIDLDITNFDINGISSLTDSNWIQIDKEEVARWYGKNISTRLMDVYSFTPKKIEFYDTLRQNKLIWLFAIALFKVVRLFYPSHIKPIEETLQQ